MPSIYDAVLRSFLRWLVHRRGCGSSTVASVLLSESRHRKCNRDVCPHPRTFIHVVEPCDTCARDYHQTFQMSLRLTRVGFVSRTSVHRTLSQNIFELSDIVLDFVGNDESTRMTTGNGQIVGMMRKRCCKDRSHPAKISRTP